MELLNDRKRRLEGNVLHKLYENVPSIDPTRQSFLKRLKTYGVFVWAGNPFDPPLCAQVGWEVVEKDMLRCVMCQQYLSVGLPSPSKHDSYKEAVRKIKSRLQEAHSKSCLYGSNPLPDSVLHIEHLSKLELLESLQKKVAQYSGIEISLSFEIEEVQDVFNWFLESSNLGQINLSNFVLSLTGWEYVSEEKSVQCDYCNRKWLLEPYILPSETSSDLAPLKTVDPTTQHQRWCAWRAADEGWKARLRQLQELKDSRDCRMKRARLHSATSRSLTENMRAVRKMLNGTL